MASKNDFGKYTGFFYPPGGHIDNGENIRDALIREIREELGVEIKPLAKIAQTSGDTGQITYWWKCDKLDNDRFIVQSGEVKSIKWFTKNEINNTKNIWPATKNFFKEYISP